MQLQPLGMYAWFGYRLPLERRLKLIAGAGFSTTCLWLGEEEELVAGGMADRMPALAREAGLSVDNTHAPFKGCNALWSDSPPAVTAALNPYMQALSFCGAHDIPLLVIHVSEGTNPPAPTQRGLDAVSELAARAGELGVVVAVENTRSPLHLECALDGIESEHLGFCYDSSHDFISGQAPGALLKKWGSRLVTTHFSDNNGVTDDHYLPGDGRIAWQVVQGAFPKASYSGALMLEVVPQRIEGVAPEDFVREAYRRAQDLRVKFGDTKS